MAPNRNTVRLLVFCLTVSLGLYAQVQGSKESQAAIDFSKDPCGNPMVESQLFVVIDGRVSKIINGQTILLSTPEAKHEVRVRLVGIRVPRHGQLAKQAEDFIANSALNKPVSIFANPEKWIKADERPDHVTGVLNIREGGEDIGLKLLSGGLARFSSPRPYAMSHYTACRYRRAEADARSQKLGVWK